ncbi:MAG: ATP-binding cassette domain-containing protein [Halioglobus sp.]
MNEASNVLLSLQEIGLCYERRGSLFKRISHEILRGINLDLYRGETLGIVGRNGCGKSSLLRIMAGIMDPTSGSVLIEPDIHRAVLAIGLGFRPDLTGRDNAYLSSILQGNSKKQAKEYLGSIKQFSELGDAFEDPVKTYSSGMQSRLGFSTALFSHVDILFIDEVLSVGDGYFQKKALSAIKEKISGDQTVVFVSHSSASVKSICDRVIWLQDGVIKMQGEVTSTVRAYEKTL